MLSYYVNPPPPELDLRRKELEKVSNLDTKISGELEAIMEKIHQFEDDIVRFGDLDGLRQEANERKQVPPIAGWPAGQFPPPSLGNAYREGGNLGICQADRNLGGQKLFF